MLVFPFHSWGERVLLASSERGREAAKPPTMFRPVPQKENVTQNISCERPRSKGKAHLERES